MRGELNRLAEASGAAAAQGVVSGANPERSESPARRRRSERGGVGAEPPLGVVMEGGKR